LVKLVMSILQAPRGRSKYSIYNFLDNLPPRPAAI
jgi:hypothetical protein